jgi:hypothetical protein
VAVVNDSSASTSCAHLTPACMPASRRDSQSTFLRQIRLPCGPHAVKEVGGGGNWTSREQVCRVSAGVRINLTTRVPTAKRNRAAERYRAVARTALLSKAAGIGGIVVGLWSVLWGVRHWNDTPIPHAWHPYASTRQRGSIAGGIPCLLLGWIGYRHGRALQAQLEHEHDAETRK